MKHRKLRIVWSVAWGIVALLLIALWVRSHRSVDFLDYYRPGSSTLLQFWSTEGVVKSNDTSAALGFIAVPATTGWIFRTAPQAGYKRDTAGHTPLGAIFRSFRHPASRGLEVPDWFLVLVAALCATTPWLRERPWRFSLRTLLIATTLVAVGLGLIVWLARSR
jgi:hypothetical protein